MRSPLVVSIVAAALLAAAPALAAPDSVARGLAISQAAKASTGTVNALTYPGADLASKVGSAQAGCGASGCAISIPQSAGVQSFGSSITLGLNQSLGCPKNGTYTGNDLLSYTGASAAFTATGRGSSLQGCGVTLGSSALYGINYTSVGSETFSTVDRVHWSGGGAATAFVKARNTSGVKITNSEFWMGTAGATAVNLAYSNDTYIHNVLLYGPEFLSPSTLDTTSQGLVCDSHCYGTIVEAWQGGWNGLHGFVMQDTVTPGTPPAEMDMSHFYADCTKGGATGLFDASLGTAALRSVIVSSWFSGAGSKSCQGSTGVDLADAHGLEFEGGGDVTMIGLRLRANTGAGYYQNSTVTGNLLIGSLIAANSIYSAGAHSGVEYTANATGFLALGNYSGNDNDVSGGQQQYGYSVGATTGYGILANNLCGTNVVGCVNEGDSGKVAYWNNLSRPGQLDAPNRVFGDVLVASDANHLIGPHIVPDFNSADSFLSGFGSNLFYDAANTTWRMKSDGASNGGAGWFFSNNPGSASGLYVVPSVGGASDQTIANASLSTSQLVSLPGGVFNFTHEFTESSDGLAAQFGSGGSVNVWSGFAASRAMFGYNGDAGSTEIAAASGKMISFHINSSFGGSGGVAALVDATKVFCVGPNTSCSSDLFTVDGAGNVREQGGLIVHVNVMTAGASYTMQQNDYVISVNKTTGSATAITLMSSPTKGQLIRIKDAKGDAATNNITITPAAGTIDGAASLVINTAYGKAYLVYDGTAWEVL